MTASVLYLEHVLTPHKRRVERVQPCSIRSLAPDWQRPHIALLDGKAILREDWGQILRDGQMIAFIDVEAIPQGGGGGSNPFRTIAMLAAMYFAPFAAEWAVGEMGATLATGSMALAAVDAMGTMVGMSLVNALIPPPKLPSPQQASSLAAASPTYDIQAQGNTARLDAAIPESFGRLQIYPDFAAQPYQEFSGNEQFLYQLLCIGRGEYDLEAIRIEDTPISSFGEITYEIIPPGGTLTLFPANVDSSIEVSGQDLPTGTTVGPFVASPPETVANYLGIDLVYPRGLYYANDSGGLDSYSVTVQISAQLINDSGTPIGSMVVLGTETFTAATTTPQRQSHRYSVTPGRYQVQVVRTDTKQTDVRYGNDVVWGSLRAYLIDTRTFGDVTLIAMRMQASNNLSMQASRKINVIATRKLPVWNGSAWSANAVTRSPAWAIAYACKQVGLTDASIDLATLLALDAIWSTRNDTFDGRFDNFLSFWEAVTKISAVGRAKPYMQGGVMRIMRDQAATIPVQLFSMRNIIKGSLSIDYLMPTPDTADAIDVGYFDGVSWAPRRVRATLPGSTAAMPAQVDLFGVTSRDQAYREGLYQAACNRYRRKLIHFSTEMEGFIPSFGDLIAVQHDMPAWGQYSESIAWNPASLTLSLSEIPDWGLGSNYNATHYIGLRKRDGSVDGPYPVIAGDNPNDVVLDQIPALTPYTGGAEERTHVVFGWAETWRQPARIVSVTPTGLFSADIVAVNEDANVHTADIGVTTPATQNSQLAGYTNAPVILGLSCRSMLGAPDKMLLTWQPSPWAEYYIIDQSSDGQSWTRTGETSTSNFTATALYGNATILRVAAVGIAKGPWVMIHYGDSADYMWSADDTTPMWNTDSSTKMWKY